MHILQPGLKLYKNYLSLEKQEQLVQIIHNILPEAPFFKAISPRKKPLGSLMTNMGEFGWYADATDGYKYINHHPNTQKKWPGIPVEIMNIWRKLADYPIDPQCCLINYYNEQNPNLGMHKDLDEQDFKAPVLSISLGNTCSFRYSTSPKSQSPSKTIKLESGTILVMGGESRLIYHSVNKVFFGSNKLLDSSFGLGRLNLTLRVVKN